MTDVCLYRSSTPRQYECVRQGCGCCDELMVVCTCGIVLCVQHMRSAKLLCCFCMVCAKASYMSAAAAQIVQLLVSQAQRSRRRGSEIGIKAGVKVRQLVFSGVGHSEGHMQSVRAVPCEQLQGGEISHQLHLGLLPQACDQNHHANAYPLPSE